MRFTTLYCLIRISRSRAKSKFLLPVMVLLACGAAMAQIPTYNVGRPPTEAEFRTWDNLVGSKGKELPPGSGTAKEGASIFTAQCSFCHGQNGEGVYPYPRLVGGVGSLNTPTPIFTVGSRMAYVTTIWDFINRAMPPWPMPRKLSPDNVYALTAFILYKNGIIKETDAMNKATLVEVQMPNRHGFYPDPPGATPGKDGFWTPDWGLGKPVTKPAGK
jgi:mono/diheme cytochrome c family protein